MDKVEVYVTPVAGGSAGGTATATFKQGGKWGGTDINNKVCNMIISNNDGGVFPKGKYDVQAKIFYSKGTGATAQFASTYSSKSTVEVK